MAANFKGQIVLVAGGTGGLGRAISLAFLREQAIVAVTYRDEREFESLRNTATDYGSDLHGYKIDATADADVRRLTDALVSQHGQIDILVNSVGGYSGGEPLWKTKSAVLDRMLALNLRSGYVLARAVVPAMLQSRKGAIINIASQAALNHAAGHAEYAASKAAAVALFDSLAADLKGTGVRVNSVLPSIIDTEANRKAMPGADFAKWPKPEDIARVVLFLSSDNAQLIHGASIPVYGDS